MLKNVWFTLMNVQHVLFLFLFSLHSILWCLHSQTTTDTTFISHSAAHWNKLTTCHISLCLRLCSCQSHCWVLLHLSFNCILPSVILNSLQQQGSFITNQSMKAECIADEPVPWLSDMFCMIQCLLLETSRSLRLDRVDVSPKAEFLVWR